MVVMEEPLFFKKRVDYGQDLVLPGWAGCRNEPGVDLRRSRATTPREKQTRKQLQCRLVLRVHVCMYACVLGAAVGTILVELSEMLAATFQTIAMPLG